MPAVENEKKRALISEEKQAKKAKKAKQDDPTAQDASDLSAEVAALREEAEELRAEVAALKGKKKALKKKLKGSDQTEQQQDSEEVEAVTDTGADDSAPDEAEAKKARKAAKKAQKEATQKEVNADAAKKESRGADAGEQGSSQSPQALEGVSAAEIIYKTSLQITVLGGPKGAKVPDCIQSLEDGPVSTSALSTMKDAGFTKPSPIQAQAWPIATQGHDLVAVAKTGSGKTLGFLLPAFVDAKVKAKGSHVKALVLAPTRELAMQIETECKKFGSSEGFAVVSLYGGVPVGPQKAALQENPGIVIATPGRLVDLMGQGLCSLKKCRYVVLDEADRMLDMGFEPQIKKVFDDLPSVEERQTLFFTATWPKNVRKMASKFLKVQSMLSACSLVPNPIVPQVLLAHLHDYLQDNTFQIFVGGGEDAELAANKAVSQRFIQATDDEKDKKLWDILQDFKEGARVVVFANTKRRVEYLSKALWEEGIGTCAIHGDRQQRERDQALKDFTEGKHPLMFATDVAARGLDIKGVTHVINFDMARDVESYVHRIGRTGRAGELGESITFWNPDYDKECTPALCKIARDAGQEVPDWLAKFEKTKTNKQWKVENAVLPPV